MKLKVPLIRQDTDSSDCIFAALSMVLSYYKIHKSVTELKAEIQEWFVPVIGIYLLEHGFAVEIVTAHPKLFTLQNTNLSQTQIRKRFFDLQLMDANNHDDEMVLHYYIEFLDKGGRVKVAVPGIEDIGSELRAGRPLIAIIDQNILGGEYPGSYLHANTIVGMNSKDIHVLDPLWCEMGGEKSWPIANYLYAITIGIRYDLDHGTLMKIRQIPTKRKREKKLRKALVKFHIRQ